MWFQNILLFHDSPCYFVKCMLVSEPEPDLVLERPVTPINVCVCLLHDYISWKLMYNIFCLVNNICLYVCGQFVCLLLFHTCTHALTPHSYTHTRTHTHAHAHVYTCTYACTHTHTHMHTHHIHTHTHTHTLTHSCTLESDLCVLYRLTRSRHVNIHSIDLCGRPYCWHQLLLNTF